MNRLYVLAIFLFGLAPTIRTDVDQKRGDDHYQNGPSNLVPNKVNGGNAKEQLEHTLPPDYFRRFLLTKNPKFPSTLLPSPWTQERRFVTTIVLPRSWRAQVLRKRDVSSRNDIPTTTPPPRPTTTTTEEQRFRVTTTTTTLKFGLTLIPGTWSRTTNSPPLPPTPGTTSDPSRTVTTINSVSSTNLPASTMIPGTWSRATTTLPPFLPKTDPPTPSISTTTSTQARRGTLVPATWSRNSSVPRTKATSLSLTTTSNGVFQNSSWTNITAKREESSIISTLCGFPLYCDMEKCFQQNYQFDPLSQCEYDGGVAVFGTIIFLLAVSIIAANCLLPIAVWKVRDMRTQHNYIKVSLAIADMLLGILLFADVLPNMVRLRNVSEYQAVQYITEDTNSPSAIITGGLWILSSQASILHLTFLSAERFIAIKWSLWHRTRKTSTIMITLAVLWAVSFACCFVPVAFKDKFMYQLQPALLVHWTILAQTVDEANGSRLFGFEGPLYGIFTLLLPYCITLTLCVLTAIVTYSKLRSRTKYFGSGEPGSHVNEGLGRDSLPRRTGKIHLKPEISVFITILMMIAAFTIALLPFTIVSFLFVANKLDCFNFSIPYASAFYLYLLSGLANPIVYTIRDEHFRRVVSGLCCGASRKHAKSRLSLRSKTTDVSA